ncbi:MAG: hypothetical protein SGARI_000478, partial [Bacillariaceae sp.]
MRSEGITVGFLEMAGVVKIPLFFRAEETAFRPREPNGSESGADLKTVVFPGGGGLLMMASVVETLRCDFDVDVFGPRVPKGRLCFLSLDVIFLVTGNGGGGGFFLGKAGFPEATLFLFREAILLVRRSPKANRLPSPSFRGECVPRDKNAGFLTKTGTSSSSSSSPF